MTHNWIPTFVGMTVIFLGAELESRLKDKENLIYEAPYLVSKDASGEITDRYCSACFEKENSKKIHLHEGYVKGVWSCPICTTDVKDGSYIAPKTYKNKSRPRGGWQSN